MLYTDGLIENTDPGAQALGMKRLRAAMTAAATDAVTNMADLWTGARGRVTARGVRERLSAVIRHQVLKNPPVLS